MRDIKEHEIFERKNHNSAEVDYLKKVEEHVTKSHMKDWTLGIAWSRMEGIVSDILEDKSWIYDSHDQEFYKGMKYGLESMLRHLKEINRM